MKMSHKRRWIFGPVIDGRHVAADYSVAHEFPISIGGFALACCTLNAQQMHAARLDTRVTVMPSIHSADVIPAHVATFHAAYGVTPTMKMHDMLVTLAALHPNFEPED